MAKVEPGAKAFGEEVRRSSLVGRGEILVEGSLARRPPSSGLPGTGDGGDIMI